MRSYEHIDMKDFGLYTVDLVPSLLEERLARCCILLDTPFLEIRYRPLRWDGAREK
jgi:hypothetical protein